MSRDFVNPGAPRLWQINGVMNGRLRAHGVDEVAGTLSIKFVVEGRARWRTEGREFDLDGSSLLVLNHGQPYSLEIDSAAETETFCLFFRPGFAESVAHAALQRLDDDPEPPRIAFASRLEPDAKPLIERLLAFRSMVHTGAPLEDGMVEDVFIGFAERVAALARDQTRERARVPIGAAHREEIYRRLCRARDAMIASVGTPLRLEDIAREAFLSPYHFHRLYRETFGETPHRFLTRLRVARAERMLASGRWSATEVCAALGFESYASFSHLIYRATGRRPSAYTRESQDSISAAL